MLQHVVASVESPGVLVPALLPEVPLLAAPSSLNFRLGPCSQGTKTACTTAKDADEHHCRRVQRVILQQMVSRTFSARQTDLARHVC